MAAYAPGIQLIPTPLWKINLRSVLTKSRWRELRNAIIDERGLKCQTCGTVAPNRSRISAHEEWEYQIKGKAGVAALVGIKLSCWHCHAVEHFGMTMQLVMSGSLEKQAIEDTINHFCRINGVDRAAFETHHAEAFKEWKRLNAMSWTVDWGVYRPIVEGSQHSQAQRNHQNRPFAD